MAHTHYEFTNMVMCDTAEVVYTGDNKITIQMIICYFKNDQLQFCGPNRSDGI